MGLVNKSLNNKGQALVEFILILPLLIMILFAIIDFGIIFNTKNSLENDSADIVALVNNSTSEVSIRNTYPNIDIKVVNNGNYKKIVITKRIDLITPGLNQILGNPYEVKVERVIPYD